MARFNSVDDLLAAAENFTTLRKGPIQGFVRGDGNDIFNSLIRGAESLPNGRYLLKDGTNIGKHFSAKSGEFTINFKRGGELFKIRIIR